jgi:hypothetical protein
MTAIDEREATLAKMRADYGLHPNASPAEITKAGHARSALVRGYIMQGGGSRAHADMRRFAEEIGLTPQQYDPNGVGGYEWPVIWDAMQAQDHRYIRIRRSADGVGYQVPPAPPKPPPTAAISNEFYINWSDGSRTGPFPDLAAAQAAASSADPRIEKLQALADRPGTPGEGAAAQAAIGRITAGAAA